MSTAIVPAVYAAINKVMRTLAQAGISKDRRNELQGYQFRGIDDVYNALAPALVDAGLICIPSMTARTCEERQTAKGSVLFYVNVTAEFNLIAVADGSSVKAGPFFGEAMDSGDKATNKAMSAAYKYWAMQTFAIPTEGDNDADATTHENIKPKPTPADLKKLDELRAASLNGMDALKKTWKGLNEGTRTRLADELQSLKDAAQQAEAVNAA